MTSGKSINPLLIEDILEKIFSLLGISQLKKCRLVHSKWSLVALRLLQKNSMNCKKIRFFSHKEILRYIKVFKKVPEKIIVKRYSFLYQLWFSIQAFKFYKAFTVKIESLAFFLVTEKCFQKFLEVLKVNQENLKSLKLTIANHNDDFNYYFQPSETQMEISRDIKLEKLSTLKLNFVSVMSGEKAIFENLIENCDCLRVFDIYLEYFYDDSLWAIKKLRKPLLIAELKIDLWELNYNEIFMKIQRFFRLKCLQMRFYRSDHINNGMLNNLLLKQADTLEELILDFNWSKFKKSQEECIILPKMERLRVLKLLFYDQNVTNFSGPLIYTTLFPNLKDFDIKLMYKYLSSISEEHIKTFYNVNQPQHMKLEKISISMINLKLLPNLATIFPKIKAIKITEMDFDLTALESFRRVWEICKELEIEELKIFYSYLIWKSNPDEIFLEKPSTDQIANFPNLNNLKKLAILRPKRILFSYSENECRKLSDLIATLIVTKMESLEEFIISKEINSFSKESLQKLATKIYRFVIRRNDFNYNRLREKTIIGYQCDRLICSKICFCRI